jgi:hypothetical protein
MRIAPLLFSLLALVPAAAMAHRDQAASAPRNALKGADCLDPSRTRSWDYVSGDELLIDAGRRKYRIQLSEQCSDLGHGNALLFDGDPISGRVCGNLGETVRVGRMRCRIARVELIDAETYREATGGTRGAVSGSGPVAD